MDQASDEHRTALYAHKKRREWGRAFLLWERNEKRGYLFEDGVEKVLARDFYELMEEVQVPAEEFEALRKRLGVHAQGLRSRSSGSNSALSFDEQLKVFRIEYPGGFTGSDWLTKHRGRDVKRRIKRHRDGAIAQARERLSQAEISAGLAGQQYRRVWDAALAVLGATDLVPNNVLEKLSGPGAEQLRSLAEDVGGLLHGEGPHEARFDRFANTLKAVFRTPSWQLATALPALVDPEHQLCVRPTSIREQLKQMAPGVTLERWPTSAQYSALLGVGLRLKEKLEGAGEKPSDLMDIYDFIRLTTRPAAKGLAAQGSATSDRASQAQSPDDATEAA